MSRKPRRGEPAAETNETAVDPRRETTGSYERQGDGSFVRTDEPQKHEPSATPAIPIESARATATALIDAGAEVPPHIQALLDAEDRADEPAAEGADSEAPPPAADETNPE